MGDCSIPYGFEYLGDDLLSPLPMITTSPATLSLFSALSTGQFVAQTEPEAGGVNTLAELARACGRLYLPSVCTGALDYR